MRADLAEQALRAAVSLREWIRSTRLLGYDPYDALRSPILARLARGPRARQLAIQALRRFPFNPRPLLGIRPYASAKALGLIAGAAARLFRSTGDEEWRSLAEESAAGARALAVQAGAGLAWGYPFDVQLRWGFYPANTPNVIATVFTASSLLVAAEVLRRPDLAADAERTGPFLDSLAVGAAERYYAYVPGNLTPIHNANLLAAALRGRLASRSGTAIPADVTAALDFSLRRQRPDGSWPYGDGTGLGWVDGFHTGYVLSALVDLDVLTARADVKEAIARGTAYYIDNLFEDDGAPRYYPGRAYPFDAHNAATAIATLMKLTPYEPRTLDVGAAALRCSLARLQTRSGWFVYQRGRIHTKRVDYLRWSDAHMLGALADAFSVFSGHERAHAAKES